MQDDDVTPTRRRGRAPRADGGTAPAESAPRRQRAAAGTRTQATRQGTRSAHGANGKADGIDAELAEMQRRLAAAETALAEERRTLALTEEALERERQRADAATASIEAARRGSAPHAPEQRSGRQEAGAGERA